MRVILSPSASSGQAPRRIFWVEPPSEILRRLSASQNDSERRIAQFRIYYLMRVFDELHLRTSPFKRPSECLEVMDDLDAH